MTYWVTRLLLANVGMFFLTGAMPGLRSLLLLYPPILLIQPWRAITYMFLHADFTHLLFNMLGLFFFGPELERHLGGRRFLWLYFLSGLGGAAFAVAFARHSAVIGASGAVFGILLAYARFWPKNQIYIWGVFPVQARWLIAFLTIMTLWGGFGGSQDGIAHFAHLGGFAGGWLYLVWMARPPAHQRRFQQNPRAAVRKPGRVQEDLRRWGGIRREELHEVNREEYDRVMAKIRQSGVESLTPDDRAFLDRLSSV
ncbi:MAG: rhomboid family intramembrane serine protease [Acidobacteriota bacterium]